MSRPLTILLIDHSAITSVRLVELLQNIKGVDKVFFAKDVKKGCAVFLLDTINVLILANHLLNNELTRLSVFCKMSGCEIILLSDYTHPAYRSWCKNIGISNLLDKASEIGQVENVLKQLVDH